MIWCPELRLTGAKLLMGEEGSICPHTAHSRAGIWYEILFSSLKIHGLCSSIRKNRSYSLKALISHTGHLATSREDALKALKLLHNQT